jgi:hypothetical protein
VRRLSRQTKGPSIKDALAGNFGEEKLSAKEQHQIYTRAGETNDFTPDTLKIKWEEFVARLTTGQICNQPYRVCQAWNRIFSLFWKSTIRFRTT